MDTKFWLSFIPSVVGGIISYLSWSNTLSIDEELVFIGLCISLLIIPIISFKYFNLKNNQIPPIYHLKGECALSKEFPKILNGIPDTQKTSATAINVSRSMLLSIRERLNGRYGASQEFDAIVKLINNSLDKESISVDDLYKTLNDVGDSIDTILLNKQQKSGLQKILYPASS